MGNLTHKKILVVEDEPEIGQLVTHYLEKEGFERPRQAPGSRQSRKSKRTNLIWSSSISCSLS